MHADERLIHAAFDNTDEPKERAELVELVHRYRVACDLTRGRNAERSKAWRKNVYRLTEQIQKLARCRLVSRGEGWDADVPNQ